MSFYKGYLNNFPNFLGRLGFGVSKPPFADQFSRRFTSLSPSDSSTLIDDIGSLNARVHYPVTYMDGSQKASLPEQLSDFTMKVQLDGVVSEGILFSLEGGGVNILSAKISDRSLKIDDGGNVLNYPISPDAGIYSLHIKIDKDAKTLTVIQGTTSTVHTITSLGNYDAVSFGAPSNGFSGYIWDIKDRSGVEFPFLYYDKYFKPSSNPLNASAGGTLKYIVGGSRYMVTHGAYKQGNNWIPKNLEGVPSDKGSSGGSFLNNSPFFIDMKYNNSVSSFAVKFFNKSDTTIWDDDLRSSSNYDSTNPYLWFSGELKQVNLYLEPQDAYKYYLWNKTLTSGNWKDLVLYDTPPTGRNICLVKSYVNLGEDVYMNDPGIINRWICRNDILH